MSLSTSNKQRLLSLIKTQINFAEELKADSTRTAAYYFDFANKDVPESLEDFKLLNSYKSDIKLMKEIIADYAIIARELKSEIRRKPRAKNFGTMHPTRGTEVRS